MEIDTINHFGGNWSAQKLEMVRKYLVAYSTIMRKQRFKYAYVDAFAGTGYQKLKEESDQLTIAFDDQQVRGFIDGSARVALRVEPRFDNYIFIERDPRRVEELNQLKLDPDFSDRHDGIRVHNLDANTAIMRLCQSVDWKSRRAVMFLDPFGMQVSWSTIEAIANTKAIDLWLLFPLGVAVNRLLKRDGQINESYRAILDNLFGTPAWYQQFYRTEVQAGLFGPKEITVKQGDYKAIETYFNDHLKSIFPGVAPNPRPLYNSKNVPLYLLHFAAANERGSVPALRIANHILRAG